MKRRSFLANILAAGIAPAVVGSGVLMPVRKIWTPYYGGVVFDEPWVGGVLRLYPIVTPLRNFGPARKPVTSDWLKIYESVL